MPLPREIREQLAVKRAAEHEQAERDKLRDLALTGLKCVAWAVVGIVPILWSAHTTDLTYGHLAYYGGIIVGNAGLTATLAAAYRRGERRGDW